MSAERIERDYHGSVIPNITPLQSPIERKISASLLNTVPRTTKRTPTVTLQASAGEELHNNITTSTTNKESNVNTKLEVQGATTIESGNTRTHEIQQHSTNITFHEDNLHNVNESDVSPVEDLKESEFVWPAPAGHYAHSFSRDEQTEAYQSDGVTSPFTQNEDSFAEGSGASSPSVFGTLK